MDSYGRKLELVTLKLPLVKKIEISYIDVRRKRRVFPTQQGSMTMQTMMMVTIVSA